MFLPEIINNFNVYKDGTKLVGVTDEVQLPDIALAVTEISGAGISPYETPILGKTEKMEMDITFHTIEKDAFSLANPMKSHEITLRGNIQESDGQGDLKQVGMRVVVKGKCKAFKPGKMKQNEAMDTVASLSLTYIMIEVGGEKMLEVDKQNSVFIIDGEDIMADIKKNC